jgi:hypothetical protein
MTTSDPIADYEAWLKSCTKPFVLVAIDLAMLGDNDYAGERGEKVYRPDRDSFRNFYKQLQKAVSLQPAIYTFRLRRGQVAIEWNYTREGVYQGELRCYGLTQDEFASLYPAVAACPGYSMRPPVSRVRHGITYIG